MRRKIKLKKLRKKKMENILLKIISWNLKKIKICLKELKNLIIKKMIIKIK